MMPKLTSLHRSYLTLTGFNYYDKNIFYLAYKLKFTGQTSTRRTGREWISRGENSNKCLVKRESKC